MRTIILLIAVGLCPCTALARGSEGSRVRSVLLNGPWEFVVGDGSESAETPRGQQRLSWKRVDLPGAFMKWSQEAANNTRFVWARRDFTISPEQAGQMAVLRWNRIASGAVAFIFPDCR